MNLGKIFTIFVNFFKLRARKFSYWNMEEISVMFLIFAIISCLVLLFMYVYFTNTNKISVHKIYLLCIIILGLAYMAIFLPFTVPDEPVHYFSAYRFSNYFLLNFEQAQQSEVIIRQSDYDFYTQIGQTGLSAEYYHKINNNLYLFSKNSQLVNFSIDIAHNAPFGYILSAIGISISRILNLSPLLTFYSGRIVNIISYALLTYLAIKRIPVGKMAVFAISTLPMTLHLISSYSYDFLPIAMAILWVSQVLYMYDKKYDIDSKDIFICVLFAIVLAPSKLVYLPLLLLVFIIPKENFKCSSKKSFLIKSGIVLAGVLVLLIVQWSSLVKTAVNDEIGWTGTPLYSLSWVLRNPFAAAKVITNTFFDKGEFYLKTLVGGSLGWFQINVPLYCYLPFFFILGYCFMRRDNEILEIKFSQKIIALIIAFATVFLILFSMFIAWTPINSPSIEGVQGRYFIPLLPIIYLLLRNKFITINSAADKYMIGFIMYWNLFAGIEYFVNSFI